MITTTNHKNLAHLLLFEEMLRAKCNHYKEIVADSKIKDLLQDVVKQSEKNTKDIIGLLKNHLDK